MTQEQNQTPWAAFSKAMADAAELAGAATVLVNARRRLPASGVVFQPGWVLAADHTIERDEDISILAADGSQLAAQVAGRDPGSDLAVLKIDGGTVTAAVAAQAEARIGELVLALGRPSDEGLQASLGVVSATGGPVRSGRGGLLERYLRTDAVPYPGFSGGPLVNSLGQVAGINTSGLARGVFLSIPARVAWQTASTLAEHGHIRRGYLGIRSQMVDLPAAAGTALGRGQQTGLLLLSVEPGSPAASSGLMVGDILVAVDGQSLGEPDDLLVQLSAGTAGRQVTMQVVRGGRVENVPVTIGENR